MSTKISDKLCYRKSFGVNSLDILRVTFYVIFPDRRFAREFPNCLAHFFGAVWRAACHGFSPREGGVGTFPFGPAFPGPPCDSGNLAQNNSELPARVRVSIFAGGKHLFSANPWRTVGFALPSSTSPSHLSSPNFCALDFRRNGDGTDLKTGCRSVHCHPDPTTPSRPSLIGWGRDGSEHSCRRGCATADRRRGRPARSLRDSTSAHCRL